MKRATVFLIYSLLRNAIAVAFNMNGITGYKLNDRPYGGSVSQLLCHLIGDYLLQSDWMAANKVKDMRVAMVHACTYSLPFLIFNPTPGQIFLILVSHAIIDRYKMARFICYGKNFLAPRSEWPIWEECKGNGYSYKRPDWLTTWLYIITDNTLHLTINYLVLL